MLVEYALTLSLIRFAEACIHLRKPEVLASTKRFIERLSWMSFRYRFGKKSSLWFLFTNKVMVRTFLAGYMIHFWPMQVMNLSEVTPSITNVRDGAAKFIESIERVVEQLEETKDWSKVDREQLMEFNTTTTKFLTAFHQWKGDDEAQIKPRMETAISMLIQGIQTMRANPHFSRESEINSLNEALQRVSNKYVIICGQTAFDEFRRTLPEL